MHKTAPPRHKATAQNDDPVPTRSKTTAFSYDDQDLIDRAKARAKARRQSFSAYICTLLEEAEQMDLERGVLVREERIPLRARKKN